MLGVYFETIQGRPGFHTILGVLGTVLGKDQALIIGAINPGMVITELITRQFEGRPEEWQRAKRIFNLIADRVETVTPWLARQILANQKSGAVIAWLTPAKMLRRFLSLPFRKRDLFT